MDFNRISIIGPVGGECYNSYIYFDDEGAMIRSILTLSFGIILKLMDW